MKKIVLLGCSLLLSAEIYSQSVMINPNNLQIPRVSALPACAAADYGRVVFLTTTNRANVCSGSGWIEVAPSGGGGGSFTLPFNGSGNYSAAGFTVMNTGGGLNSAGIQGMTMSAITGASGILGNAFETAPLGETVGVRGSNSSTNNNGVGVKGTHDGAGYGVFGVSLTGTGVYGYTQGSSSSGYGVFGQAGQTSGVGVFGNAFGTNGVAVWGKADHSTGAGGYFSNSAVGGVALSTSGRLRFQGNGAAVNKVLVSTDISGTAEWKSLTRNEILKLGPAAFHSHISSNESTMGSQGISMTSATGSFHANVSLPDGATITQVRVYYIDNDGVSPATGLGLTGWSLQKMTNSGSGSAYSNVANSTFTNISASSSVLFSGLILPTPEVVNNATTFYRVVVTMPSSLNLVLVGAEISYSYTVNN